MPGRGSFSRLTSSEFAANYTERFGAVVNEHGAGSFGGMCILMAAIEAAGTLDTETVAATLRALKLEEFYGHPISFNANQQNAAEPLVLQYQRAVRTRMTIVAPQKLSNGVLQFPMPTWEQRRCRLVADSSTAEAAVVAGSGGSGSSASASASTGECSGHGSCTLGGTCACVVGYSGVSCACFGDCVPMVLGVVPRFSSPFGGETLTIVGRNFRSGGTLVSVTLGGKVCGSVTQLGPSTISCVTPAGEGADLAVQVTVDGAISAPVPIFAYNLPRVSTINREWLWHEGSMVRVQGEDFVTGQTYCRLGELSKVEHAVVVDRENIMCKVGAETLTVKNDELLILYVSNDNGQRWVSGLFGNRGEVRWFNNSLDVPVTVFSEYSEVRVAVIVSTHLEAAVIKIGIDNAVALAEREGLFGSKIKVNVSWIESNLEGATAVAATEALLLKFPDIVGIIGSSYSVTSIPLAFNVSNKQSLPMISFGASTSVLGDKAKLPYFLRTCASSNNLADEMNHLFKVFSWKRIGIVTSTGELVKNYKRRSSVRVLPGH